MDFSYQCMYVSFLERILLLRMTHEAVDDNKIKHSNSTYSSVCSIYICSYSTLTNVFLSKSLSPDELIHTQLLAITILL